MGSLEIQGPLVTQEVELGLQIGFPTCHREKPVVGKVESGADLQEVLQTSQKSLQMGLLEGGLQRSQQTEDQLPQGWGLLPGPGAFVLLCADEFSQEVDCWGQYQRACSCHQGSPASSLSNCTLPLAPQ